MKEDWIYKRGDLYYANLNPYFGSEQGGTRPVLVGKPSAQMQKQKNEKSKLSMSRTLEPSLFLRQRP